VDEQPRRDMTVREAGRKGGEAVKKKYGPEFYGRIGKKGGARVRDTYGPEFYERLGRIGGLANRDKAREGSGEERQP
jgi:general stress protein YciG